MAITYKTIHDFSEQDLKDLFLSVKWSSGHFPDKLVIAMKNFKTVVSAWDGDKLIGMICAMDDGIMNAYKDYLRIVVVAYDKEMDFYAHCGFKKATDASPMFITSLWT